jgi:hypothetical protein
VLTILKDQLLIKLDQISLNQSMDKDQLKMLQTTLQIIGDQKIKEIILMKLIDIFIPKKLKIKVLNIEIDTNQDQSDQLLHKEFK